MARRRTQQPVARKIPFPRSRARCFLRALEREPRAGKKEATGSDGCSPPCCACDPAWKLVLAAGRARARLEASLPPASSTSGRTPPPTSSSSGRTPPPTSACSCSPAPLPRRLLHLLDSSLSGSPRWQGESPPPHWLLLIPSPAFVCGWILTDSECIALLLSDVLLSLPELILSG